ncbi:hypothetical protein BJ508DRAFT_330798 [Ascobolus immersus RN42]|uniref:Uncharacterized protein n=1 Tax=Ascobolus immersus RN42 TaxID=1160509 RepID=A0A3N4HWB6_ASCIM|nr:hypothetical protein BJ508DRAFT_330798 [Ascobolus immersus RN42]
MPLLLNRDLYDDCDRWDPATGACLDSTTSFVKYIVASLFIFVLLLSLLILLCLSRRRRRKGQQAYYGTRWIFRSPPGVPPRPGVPLQTYSAGGQYGQQQQGGYYASPPPGQYYPPPGSYTSPGGFQPAPHQTPYTTGSTYTTMPTSPGQAHVQPHYGGQGLRGGEELPPPPVYTPGPYAPANVTVRDEQGGTSTQQVGK